MAARRLMPFAEVLRFSIQRQISLAIYARVMPTAAMYPLCPHTY